MGKIDFKDSQIVHKSAKLDARTNSYMKLNKYFTKLYKEIVPENAKIRQLGIALMELSYEGTGQIDLFSLEEKNEKEKKIQKAVIEVKNRFGKNSLLRANSLKKEATGRQRNKMIGGHSGENYDTQNDE